MKKKIEVVAAVIIKDNLIFCAKRPDKGETALKWEFPGGKVEVGETREMALIREIKEELDSLISVDSFLTTVKYEYNSFNLIMHVFLCSLIEGTLEISEHIDSKWVKKGELSNLDFALADKEVIKTINNLL